MKVELLIDGYPHEQKELCFFLRDQILQMHPAITEKVSYGLPFFYLKKPLCYLNAKKSGGVDLGLFYGFKLENILYLLNTEKRKQVASLFIPSLEELNPVQLNQVLTEAVSYNLKKIKGLV